MFGPTKDDPTFQMIVVSSETVGGGGKVNEIRVANGLEPLKIHRVELLPDVNKEDPEEEDKISSSNLRLRHLGTLLRPPQPNPNLPEKPYIIGLTGGIASGKSGIAKRLEGKGAAVINCDVVGHQIYQVGTPGYNKVVDKFGKGILDETGAIDRQKLGAVVFSDKTKLHELNQLVWPLIIAEALQQAQQKYTEGHQVVVLEAAVLIRANWFQYCHELWVSFIPRQEAIRRVVERNKLAEEEAIARVDAQPTNAEQLEHANVAFCTLWRPECTEKQVNRAWDGLMGRLNSGH